MSYIGCKKTVDVDEMNFQIPNQIVGELMTYKWVDSITYQDQLSHGIFKFVSIAYITTS